MSTAGVWKTITKPIGTGTADRRSSIPWGVTVAPDGSIWVSDTGNNRIVSMETTGQPHLQLPTRRAWGSRQPPQDIGHLPVRDRVRNGPEPTVYLTDIWNNRVLVLHN